MTSPEETLFVTPQDVERAFYEALEKGNLEAMRRVWSDEEQVVCVHPGGAPLIGQRAVHEAWQQIFAHSGKFNLQVVQQTAIVTPSAVITHVLEHFSQIGEESLVAPVVATNIYTRGVLGWRMVGHHASPAPPDSLAEVPTVLH